MVGPSREVPESLARAFAVEVCDQNHPGGDGGGDAAVAPLLWLCLRPYQAR